MAFFPLLRRLMQTRSRPFSALILVSCMLFFWSLFDGLVSYVTPVLFVQNGFSKSSMGFIIGSSSIAGAAFDFFLSKFLLNTHYRRMYLLMLTFSFLMPLLLWKSTTILIYLLAMTIWGLYYDLLAFGNFDFISRTAPSDKHSDEFGIIFIFKSLGYLVAPLLAGYVIVTTVDEVPFVLMVGSLVIASLFYYLLIKHAGNIRGHTFPQEHKKLHILREMWIWRQIGKKLLPVLGLTLFLNVIDAYFWTIGPLIVEQTENISAAGGLLLTAYTLPSLFVGFFVGPIVRTFRKKHTAFLSLLIGSLILATFFVSHTMWISILIVFLSSMFTSLAWPAINGAYADYISESPTYQREIQALEDFATNVGYIIGPVTGGILAEILGNTFAMSLLGALGIFVAFLLFAVTPKEIRIGKKL